MNQQSPIGQIIKFFIDNPQLLIIGFVVLSSVINFLGNSGKRMREAQETAAKAEELRRRGSMLETEQREANPNTQSYDGYLKRNDQPDTTLSRPTPSPQSSQELKDLQADILEALGMGTQAKTSSTNPQEELRRKLAQKMGRTTPQSAPQAPLGRGMPPPPAPAGMKRPSPRAENKPIQTTITSNIETYLEQSRPERLENDSRPDSLGHSQRQPHFDRPQGLTPEQEGGSYYGELGSTVVALRGIQEVRGKEIVPTNRPVSSNQKRFIDPKEAVAGFVWNEILSTPRSKVRR